MKQLCSLLFLVAIVSMIFSCDKPHPNIIQSNSPSHATAVFATSLKDSLSVKTFRDLQINNVTGVKIVHLGGLDARYFEYEAEPQIVLSALGRSPFELQSEISDTTCRAITYNDLEKISLSVNEAERPYIEAMLNTNPDEFEIYECIKSPVLHHVAINRFTGKVFHRIVQLI